MQHCMILFFFDNLAMLSIFSFFLFMNKCITNKLILDCMNANQNVILGRTETIKINLKSKSSLFQENESFEVKVSF